METHTALTNTFYSDDDGIASSSSACCAVSEEPSVFDSGRPEGRGTIRVKKKLMKGIFLFWQRRMTPEKCCTYIDHTFKVLPLIVAKEGGITGE